MPRIRLNLHHLVIFHEIAETGSINAATRNLHISQPALSREIKEFEDRLGVALFERFSRGMRLTQAGEVLHDYSSRLFDIAHSAESAMREIAGARQGELSLGASNTIGTYVLPPVLARFRQTYPGVRISLFVGNTQQVSQGVADMRFMLGFIEGPLHVKNLSVEQFQTDELLPVVAAGYPLASRKRMVATDISGLPLLMREEGSGTRELVVDALRTNAVEQGSVMEFGNTEAIKQAALHGGGIAWLPRISIIRELENAALVALPTRKLIIQRSLSVIYRSGVHASPSATAFLNLLDTHD